MENERDGKAQAGGEAMLRKGHCFLFFVKIDLVHKKHIKMLAFCD